MKIPTLKLHYWKSKEVNGIAPVAIVATLQGKRKYYTTGVKVEGKFFKDGNIDKKAPNADYLNQILKVRFNEVERDFLKQAASGEIVELNKEVMKKNDDNPKFNAIGLETFNALSNRCVAHYIKRCIVIINEFKLIVGDVTFNQISVGTLQRYETYLCERGIAGNTINRRFKWLKQVANYAANHYGVSIKAFNLFKPISYVQPLRSYLTVEKQKLLESLVIDREQLNNVRNAFLIGCSTGLRFSDLQFFDYKKSVVLDNGIKRIILSTQKTGEVVSIKVDDRMDNLLKQLKPLPTNAYTNRLLKELAAMIEVDTLSFHISRHTLATTAITKGVRIEAVSKILGHSNIKTTQIYAKIANPVLDAAIDLLNA